MWKPHTHMHAGPHSCTTVPCELRQDKRQGNWPRDQVNRSSEQTIKDEGHVTLCVICGVGQDRPIVTSQPDVYNGNWLILDTKIRATGSTWVWFVGQDRLTDTDKWTDPYWTQRPLGPAVLILYAGTDRVDLQTQWHTNRNAIYL